LILIKSDGQLRGLMAGMDTAHLPPSARKAALDLVKLLQEAHFAARQLESYIAWNPADRLVDRIHAARLLAEQLRAAD
jgi:hypothetical protein